MLPTTALRVLWVLWCLFWALTWLMVAIGQGPHLAGAIQLALTAGSLWAIRIPVGRISTGKHRHE